MWTRSSASEATGHDAADREREADQQVQPDRAADHLGDVRGDHDEGGLQPKKPASDRAEAFADELRDGSRRDIAEFRGEKLYDTGGEVDADEHPQQKRAVFGTGREVRSEVARINVGNGGDECGPEDGNEPMLRRALSTAAAHNVDGSRIGLLAHRAPSHLGASTL